MARHIDYLIVGQGLAGSAIAMQLLKIGKRILVVDQPRANTASRVAAGLFNPITGRRPLKTWMAEALFPYLHDYYRWVEEIAQHRFFFPMPIYRPFVSVSEQNEWMALSADESYRPFIADVYTRPMFEHLNDDQGGLLLKQCGYIDTIVYLEAVRSLLIQRESYRNENLLDGALQFATGHIRFRDYEARAVVFCRGTSPCQWFGWLPVRPLKGETITLQSSFHAELIVNRGVYIVPGRKAGEWRVGATYNPADTRSSTTEEGRKELAEKAQELVRFPVNIVDQDWGVRPTTPDRRPLLGRHPEYPQAFVFNGLGTKGVSLAPYWSEALLRLMENGVPLNKDVDIERYKLLYWSSPK